MRNILVLFSVMVLLPLATGELEQNYTLEDGTLEVKQSINLECSGTSCPVNYWSFEWPMLEGARNIQIKDSRGEIDEWNLDNQSLSIDTNRGPLRTEEKVNITYQTTEVIETEGNLTFARFTPPNLQNSTSRFSLSAENLTSVAYGNNLAYPDSDEYSFYSDIRPEIVLSEAGGERKHAFNFVNSDPIEIEFGLELIENKTSVDPLEYEIPVVVYGSDRYVEEFDDWSIGKLDGGIIYLKDNEADLRPTLVHETIHALNKDKMEWKRFESHIIDEGLATYIEGIYRDKKAESGSGIQISAGLFGDTRVFYGSDDTYEVDSRGDFEQLVEVVESENEFYRDWKTYEEENREFGYAYSEFIIKHHHENPNQEIEDFYQVDENETLPREEKWGKVNNLTEMHPCSENNETRECLEESVQKSDVYEEGVESVAGSSLISLFFQEIREIIDGQVW